MITLENIWNDDNKLRRVFSWLTRIQAGRKFGSLPIGWYQSHQCACIDKLKELCGMAPLRCKLGHIQFKDNSGKWQTAISAISLFQHADNKTRS